ncbi:hypothetical protein ACJ72_08644 [Emergomyces africanus]|uniref:Uncharacterized protein n=1 Tax=Emergomyces africanus TaxID=1955775 RepID=A0A1B7NJZ3_9EURO|nr:hypothetical protein ACJ72_08644 [Emergomyces africanus]
MGYGLLVEHEVQIKMNSGIDNTLVGICMLIILSGADITAVDSCWYLAVLNLSTCDVMCLHQGNLVMINFDPDVKDASCSWSAQVIDSLLFTFHSHITLVVSRPLDEEEEEEDDDKRSDLFSSDGRFPDSSSSSILILILIPKSSHQAISLSFSSVEQLLTDSVSEVQCKLALIPETLVSVQVIQPSMDRTQNQIESLREL